MKDLHEFLVVAELQQYLDGFQSRLKVTTVDQIKYVEDEDLSGIGMSKPEIRRLRQFFKKECPQSTLDRLKRVCRHV
jgi:activated CDC42 kinase 1